MLSKKPLPTDELIVNAVEEPTLLRVALSGSATVRNVRLLREARARYESSNLPVLVVDDGLVFADAVAYGALVQWSQACRNRNVGWAMVTDADGAGRMFQMSGVPASEVLFAAEEAGRAALDRGSSGERVVRPAMASLAIEGLRPK